MQKVMSKYDYVGPNPRIISEETCTVPDLVLSMADIYRKYAVTGDISALPGAVRPIVVDDADVEDPINPDYEEFTDVLEHSRRIRRDVTEDIQDDTPASDEKDSADSSSDNPSSEEERSDDDNEDEKK